MDDDTSETSVHVSVWVNAGVSAVYEIASDEEQLSKWAAGLADPALAAVDVQFVPANDFGVLDHVVRLPSGESVYNPMRVIPGGVGDVASCEVVFTVRRRPGMTDGELAADVAAVRADLDTLKRLVEA